MINLGASKLDNRHGEESMQACTGMAFFLAWHVLYRTSQEADFVPPAQPMDIPSSTPSSIVREDVLYTIIARWSAHTSCHYADSDAMRQLAHRRISHGPGFFTHGFQQNAIWAHIPGQYGWGQHSGRGME